MTYCDKCSLPFSSDYLQCDNCGDNYCEECDPHFEKSISFSEQGYSLDFCRMSCIEEYIEMVINCPDGEVVEEEE